MQAPQARRPALQPKSEADGSEDMVVDEARRNRDLQELIFQKHVETLDSDPVAVCHWLRTQIGDEDKASEYFRPAAFFDLRHKQGENLYHMAFKMCLGLKIAFDPQQQRPYDPSRCGFEDELKPYSQSRTGEGKVQWNSWAFVFKRICDEIQAIDKSDLNLLDHRRHFGVVGRVRRPDPNKYLADRFDWHELSNWKDWKLLSMLALLKGDGVYRWRASFLIKLMELKREQMGLKSLEDTQDDLWTRFGATINWDANMSSVQYPLEQAVMFADLHRRIVIETNYQPRTFS